MDVVSVAVAIVAAALGGGAYWGASRLGAGAWLAFSAGLLAFALIWGSGASILAL